MAFSGHDLVGELLNNYLCFIAKQAHCLAAWDPNFVGDMHLAFMVGVSKV